MWSKRPDRPDDLVAPPPTIAQWHEIAVSQGPINVFSPDWRRTVSQELIRRGFLYEGRNLISGKLVPLLGRTHFPPRLPSFSVLDETAAGRGVEVIRVDPQPEAIGFIPASVGTETIPTMQARPLVKRDHWVAVMQEGHCVVSPWGYAVFSRDNAYATDFCFNDGPMIPWTGVVPEAQRLAGTVAVLTHSWSHAVFHWNLETFPRFELMRLAGLLDQIDMFVVRSFEEWHWDYVDSLGIPREKFVNIGQIGHIQADRLIVCSSVEGGDWTSHPPYLQPEAWISKMIADLVPDPDPTAVPTDKIYISRANAGSRRLFNGDDVRIFLEANGFRTVFFEEMNLAEKARHMREAAVVVTPVGAAMTYIPFMRPGSKMVGLYSDENIGPPFDILCAHAGVTHVHAVFPNIARFFPSQMILVAEHLREQLIDIEHLAEVLRAADIPVPMCPEFTPRLRRLVRPFQG